MYNVRLSGDRASAETLPFAPGFQERRAPLSRRKAAQWLRDTSPVPAGAPGGRTAVKSPPMYTVFLNVTTLVTRPLVWKPGSAV